MQDKFGNHGKTFDVEFFIKKTGVIRNRIYKTVDSHAAS